MLTIITLHKYVHKYIEIKKNTSNNCCDLASRSLLAASCFSVLSSSLAKRACSRSNLAAALAACCLLATSILCSTGKLVFNAAFNSSNLNIKYY